MASAINLAQKMIMQAPKCFAARDINQISLVPRSYEHPEIRMPSKIYDSKGETDQYNLGGWDKAKKAISENWESVKKVGTQKNKELLNEAKKGFSGYWNTKITSSKKNKEFVDDLNKVKRNVMGTVEDVSKIKSRAERNVADDWNAVKQGNSKKSRSVVDQVQKNATSKVDEASKALKNKTATSINEKAENIKNRIIERGDKLKAKISK